MHEMHKFVHEMQQTPYKQLFNATNKDLHSMEIFKFSYSFCLVNNIRLSYKRSSLTRLSERALNTYIPEDMMHSC